MLPANACKHRSFLPVFTSPNLRLHWTFQYEDSDNRNCNIVMVCHGPLASCNLWTWAVKRKSVDSMPWIPQRMTRSGKGANREQVIRDMFQNWRLTLFESLSIESLTRAKKSAARLLKLKVRQEQKCKIYDYYGQILAKHHCDVLPCWSAFLCIMGRSHIQQHVAHVYGGLNPWVANRVKKNSQRKKSSLCELLGSLYTCSSKCYVISRLSFCTQVLKYIQIMNWFDVDVSFYHSIH